MNSAPSVKDAISPASSALLKSSRAKYTYSAFSAPAFANTLSSSRSILKTPAGDICFTRLLYSKIFSLVISQPESAIEEKTAFLSIGSATAAMRQERLNRAGHWLNIT